MTNLSKATCIGLEVNGSYAEWGSLFSLESNDVICSIEYAENEEYANEDAIGVHEYLKALVKARELGYKYLYCINEGDLYETSVSSIEEFNNNRLEITSEIETLLGLD